MKETRRTLRPRHWSRFAGLAALAAALLLVLLPARVRAAGELTVAAAADLQYAMRALIQSFERYSGEHVRLVLGSSGNLTTQIEHGAPFDLFFSADVQHPRQLESKKLIEPGSLVRYAVGQLVVYVPKNSTLDFEHHGLAALTGPSVRKIAIANPRFAPYGRAAVAALRHAGLYETLEPRLVLGEDVSQTTQFVVSGNAQASLTALSLMFAPGTQAHGRYWVVPAGNYPPLEQAAVIVARSKEKQLARAFLDYVKTPEGRAIFAHYGFAKPAPENNQ
jgi:molybdate transport system substrate-binding protein